MVRLPLIVICFLALAFSIACSEQPAVESQMSAQSTEMTSETIAGPVIVYSSRQEHLIKPLFDRLLLKQGLKCNTRPEKTAL